MDVIEQFESEARGQGGRVVLPEGCDRRALRAARRLKDEGLACPILLGEPEEIARAADEAAITLDHIEQRCPRTDPELEKFAELVASSREKMSPEMAARLMLRPL